MRISQNKMAAKTNEAYQSSNMADEKPLKMADEKPPYAVMRKIHIQNGGVNTTLLTYTF
jgi:hypothetical protein